ncbi:hypothetical protein ACO03_12910 [Pantoea ananatis]|jgi:hypothetical protein|nr:hypothetical protein ACO03_12910 [Pantoea ananatis]OWY77432.1 hypothetical protein CDN97_04070 [Pantoea sp. AMG 501]PQL00199.1 hypothetical protein CG435_14110 [Pantoea ananatis]
MANTADCLARQPLPPQIMFACEYALILFAPLPFVQKRRVPVTPCLDLLEICSDKAFKISEISH